MRALALFLLLVLSGLVGAEELAIETTANVRKGPSVKFPAVNWFLPGERLKLLNKKGNYLLVERLKDRAKGWIYFPAQGWSDAHVEAYLRVGEAAPGSDPPMPVELANANAQAAHLLTLETATSLGAPTDSAADAKVNLGPVTEPVQRPDPSSATGLSPVKANVAAGSMPHVDRVQEPGEGTAAPSSLAQPLQLPRHVRRMPDLMRTDLTDLGFNQGYVFEGVQATHARRFAFPLPRDVTVDAGTLRIAYAASPQLNDFSILRVDIDGRPYYSGALERDGRKAWIEIPIAAAEFAGRSELAVEVRASLIVSEDRCFDARMSANYLQLLPETGLDLQFGRYRYSVRAGWELLPKELIISLQEGLSKEMFANALVISRELLATGKRLSFTYLPELGDIVVAERGPLEQLLQQRYHATEALREIWGEAREYVREGPNVAFFPVPDRNLLLLTEDMAGNPAGLPTVQWRSLAVASRYQVFQAQPFRASWARPGHFEIPLVSLGLDAAPKFVASSSEWLLDLGPDHLPPDKILELLQFHIVSTPSQQQFPVMFYVYLNNILQEAVELENSGNRQQFSVHLNEYDQRAPFNSLRFVAQRSDDPGDCKGELPSYPIQIESDSSLVVRDGLTEPEQFYQLQPYLARGFDLYLTREVLTRPGRNLAFLAELLNVNRYRVDPQRIHFFNDGDPIQPKAPFVIFGRPKLDPDQAGVYFDRGRVEVRGHEREMLLNVDDLPGITISQIVKTAGHFGLWVLPADDQHLPEQGAFFLNADAVAFADKSGVVLTLAGNQQEVAYVDYPEYLSWFDLIGKNRFWLMAVAWVLLTLLLVHLYLKAREHKRASDG